ncbi:hypothetical protein Tco_0029816, partial [Tanacetum coccineum]
LFDHQDSILENPNIREPVNTEHGRFITAMYTAETQVNGDDGQEFGANLVFHQPAFLVDASFEDGDLWGKSTSVASTSLHREWYDYNERTNHHPVGGTFDLEWLGNECSRIVSSSGSQLPQDELAMAICRVLDSGKAGDEIAGGLLDLVGDGAFETVQDLLMVRPNNLALACGLVIMFH